MNTCTIKHPLIKCEKLKFLTNFNALRDGIFQLIRLLLKLLGTENSTVVKQYIRWNLRSKFKCCQITSL